LYICTQFQKYGLLNAQFKDIQLRFKDTKQ